jgi:hypothetical protein
MNQGGGPPEVLGLRLAEALRALQESGWEVELVAAGPPGAGPAEPSRARVVRVQPRGPKALRITYAEEIPLRA